jgi:regulator of RNase E activity RraA
MWESENFDMYMNEALHRLFPALIGDVMDKMGYLHQFLPATIKPLHPDMIIFGKAMPVLEADFFSETYPGAANEHLNKPFGLMFEALDDLKQDEVYICTGASLRYALWGGLMSVRAMKLMAAGCVLHGYSRDTREILKLGFPTFSMGTYAQDQGPRGKVIDYRVPIEIEGVRIHPGDVVYGDRDGVVIVPSAISEEVFSKAIEKARGEQLVGKALSEGMSTVDAFQQFGIM